ncbi:phage head closure protein [Pikeienuella piscinae]|uniref:Phage head closure protein n=1 Tax=Pikeienuella piscinae TaxID=2748098 RepID=A0A7L5BY30_9RHOB|nr:phage head closure protein [Pikeienuella piscinae]QIE54509.1 phage head closure protein [Pikeienuella piscinae]
MSGELTRRLTLEERATTPDGAGGLSDSWVVRGVHWAEIKTASAREGFAGGRPASRVTHRALIRYADFGSDQRPVPDQRFREGERIFAIRGVAEADDRRERLICWLEEGTLT